MSTENMTAAVAKKFPPLQIESQSLYSGQAKVRAEKQIYFAFFFFCGGFVACFSGGARNFALYFLSIGSLKHSEQ
jgi:hypothetical protein